MDSPATIDDAHELWVDSTSLPPATVTDLLAIAWTSCEEFIPADQLAPAPAPTTVPRRWVMANVYHARDLWNASIRNGDVIGFADYAVRVRPLSDTVAALLRPRRGRPQVG